MADVSVVILALDEARHIRRCIDGARAFANEIFVIDANSTDDTQTIAKAAGAKVSVNRWINYSSQFNWALENLPIATKWTMRLDADEIVTPALAGEIKTVLDSLDEDVAGIYVKRRVHFMGKWIRHGGYYPTWLLRIWRTKRGRCEERWMDEHIVLNRGRTIRFKHDVIDDNLNGLTWWTAKHNQYASREAIDLLNIKYRFLPNDIQNSSLTGSQDRRRRWAKEKIYAKLPLGIRPLLYFLYRYLLRLGFLDGVKGAIFHVLQGFWYRFLVDAKCFEIERRLASGRGNIKEIIQEQFGISVQQKVSQ